MIISPGFILDIFSTYPWRRILTCFLPMAPNLTRLARQWQWHCKWQWQCHC